MDDEGFYFAAADANHLEERLMSDGLIRMDVMLGTVELGRWTGRWIKDADGWSTMEMTDIIERDQYGREVSRRPTPPTARIRFLDDQPRDQPWWAFWRY